MPSNHDINPSSLPGGNQRFDNGTIVLGGVKSKKSQEEATPGVRGWLLFFCVVLTIIHPIYLLIADWSVWDELPAVELAYPALAQWMKEVTVIEYMIGAFGVYAGFGLWNIRPNAVKTAKLALALFVIQAVAPFVILYLSKIPEPMRAEMIPDMIRPTLRTLFFVFSWYTYLSRSDRVKATYAEPVWDRLPSVPQRSC